MNLISISEERQKKAWDIVRELDLAGEWERIGAKVNFVGSLQSGLLMKNRDIDMHVYMDRLDITESFSVVSRLASRFRIKQVLYGNGIDTDEECIEWHLTYLDQDGETWKIDIIHIRSGSAYDGAVEKVTEGVRRVLTPETRDAILHIKWEMPQDIQTMGIEIYCAVLRDGVRTIGQFVEWKKSNSIKDVFEWMP